MGIYFRCTLEPQTMYLKRLYREWPLVFWLIMAGSAAQVYSMFKGIENVPFFLYHMYSKKHEAQDSIEVFILKTPYGFLNHKELSNREEELLMNSAMYYSRLRQSGDGTAEAVEKRFKQRVSKGAYQYLVGQLVNSNEAMDRFANWWTHYLRTVTGDKYRALILIRSYVYSKAPYRKSDSDFIILKADTDE